MCEHKKFKSEVSVNRSEPSDKTLEIPTRFFLKINIECVDCGQKFQVQGPIFGINSMEIIPRSQY